MQKKLLSLILGTSILLFLLLIQNFDRDGIQTSIEPLVNENEIIVAKREETSNGILQRTLLATDDQLLDHARRFQEENKEIINKWKITRYPLPNFKGKPVENQNPIQVGLQLKETEKNEPNYAKDRLNELITIANNVALEKELEELEPTLTTVLPPNARGKLISNQCYVPEGRHSCAPQYIVAGAMKCGTTSMFSYLTSHPRVVGLNPNSRLNGKTVLANKEVRFWLDPSYSAMIKTKGEQGAFFEYLDLFYPITDDDPYFENSEQTYANLVTGEASPMYICQQGVAQRIYRFLPYVKIIMMFRNPIDRAYSELWFKDSLTKGVGQTADENVIRKRFQLCLEYEADILDLCRVQDYSNPDTRLDWSQLGSCTMQIHNLVRSGRCSEESMHLCIKYEQRTGGCAVNNIRNSLYSVQMKEWLDVFPRENLMVIQSEDFYEETSHWMELTSSFLGIDKGAEEFKWDMITRKAFNIVNPGTSSAQGMVIEQGGAGLKIGGTSAENVGKYPDIEEESRAYLDKFFAPLKRDLEKMTGKRFSW